MADIDYNDYEGIPRIGAGQVQRVVRLTAGVCSIALMIGAGVWGYRVAVRDVTGIPLIEAAEGAMRVSPANPGGSVANHQGMAINAIAAIGAIEALPDEIILAPEPAELSLDDTPGLAALPALVAELALSPVPQGPMPLEAAAFAPIELVASEVPINRIPTEYEAGAQVSNTDDAVAMALAEALSAEMETLDDGVIEAVVEPDADGLDYTGLDGAGLDDAGLDDAGLGDAGGGLSRSIRPQARPATLRVSADLGAAEVALDGASSQPLPGEIDPATLALGTRLVQLGAFDSASQARSEWVKLVERFGDLMSGKAVVIEAAESGGRTFYRLRGHGFAGEDDVRRFCAALVAENAACIPASVR